MKAIKQIIAATLLVAATSVASAQTLWTGVRYGMSSKEVSNLIRDAKPVKGSTIVTGARELLHIEHYSLAGSTFGVAFFFLSDQLVQVMLSPEKWESNDVNLKTFDAVTANFRGKYGIEKSREVSKSPYGLSAEAVWITGQSRISVSVIPVTQITSMAKINFRSVDPRVSNSCSHRSDAA